VPSFSEHINQAKRNIEFLKLTNQQNNSFWDWQVTICFYVGVHLVNAHIAQKANMHYRKHNEVNEAINPYNLRSLCRFPEDIFLLYSKLQNLSRRSRYLINEDLSNSNPIAHFTHDKHFAKSIRHLENLMNFMRTNYSVNFDRIKIDCIEFIPTNSNFFFK